MYKRDGVETKERADERRTAAPRRRRDDLLAAVIAHQQIAVVFQPQINPSTGAVEGAEALARWDRVAGAEQLFARAAAAGLSERLSRLVQTKALRAAAAWEGPLRRLAISINLLPDEIVQEGFVAWFLETVGSAGKFTVKRSSRFLYSNHCACAAPAVPRRRAADRTTAKRILTSSNFSAGQCHETLPGAKRSRDRDAVCMKTRVLARGADRLGSFPALNR